MSNIKILVVEDDDVIRTELARLAIGFGRVEEASSVQEAMRMLSETPYELVFVDLGLSDGSGFELIEAANRNPTPPMLIVVSSTLSIVDRNRALAMGARDFISKPFFAAEVEMRIRRVMETRVLKTDETKKRDESSHSNHRKKRQLFGLI